MISLKCGILQEWKLFYISLLVMLVTNIASAVFNSSSHCLFCKSQHPGFLISILYCVAQDNFQSVLPNVLSNFGECSFLSMNYSIHPKLKFHPSKSKIVDFPFLVYELNLRVTLNSASVLPNVFNFSFDLE